MLKKLFTLKHLKENSFLLSSWILLMVTAASIWLSYEFWRLTWDSSLKGAIDLVQRYEDVYFWFRGFPIYGVITTASYPPASYTILWPMLGWLSIPAARWLWAFLYIGALVWLCAIFSKESKAEGLLERIFITLIPLSMYATGAAIGNGQLIVFILPALLTALLLMQRADYTWKTEFAACCLFLFALIKPSMTAPFCWIVLFIPGRIRTVFMVIAGYAGLSLLAASFQEQGLFALVPGWLANSSEIMSGLAKYFSQSNIHSWFAALGIEQWAPPVSLMILALLGIWIRMNRKADPWLIISFVAIIARLWTYHAWYDDLLIASLIAPSSSARPDCAFQDGQKHQSTRLLAAGSPDFYICRDTLHDSTRRPLPATLSMERTIFSRAGSNMDFDSYFPGLVYPKRKNCWQAQAFPPGLESGLALGNGN